MEFLGLQRAIFHSGVRTFLGANWQIDTEASVEFMKAFIDRYQKYNSKTAALQHAQKLFIEHDNLIYQHPYFWVAFWLSGASE